MLKYVLRVPSLRPDDEPLPLVLLMHGRGADANDLADLAPMLDPPGGARFVFANAPKPFEAAPGMTFGRNFKVREPMTLHFAKGQWGGQRAACGKNQHQLERPHG